MAWFGSADEVTRTYVTFGDRHQPLFGQWTVDVVNGRLRELCAVEDVERVTSYTFRRNYMRTVLSKHNGDAVAAQRYSLHLNPHILEAHYAT